MREHGDRFEHAEQARGRSPACLPAVTARFRRPPRAYSKFNLLIHESPLTDALFLLVSKSDEVTTT